MPLSTGQNTESSRSGAPADESLAPLRRPSNAPAWLANASIPWKSEELVRADGSPTYRIHERFNPEFDLLPRDSVKFLSKEATFALPPDLASQKQSLIDERQTANREKDKNALARWEAEGAQGERPLATLFYDSPLARVVPAHDIQRVTDEKGGMQLQIQFGQTSYFDYVASRTAAESRYPDEAVAMPLACCGVVLAASKTGDKFLLYTVRGNANESYAGYFHLLGTMPGLGDPRSFHSADRWTGDAVKEAPFRSSELKFEGILGIAEDTHFRHTEVCHLGTLSVSLEEVFSRGPGNSLFPHSGRVTDKQVVMRAVPWESESIKGLILGDVSADPDPRPWLNTGLANLLLAGRREFGDRWYRETIEAHTSQLQFIPQK